MRREATLWIQTMNTRAFARINGDDGVTVEVMAKNKWWSSFQWHVVMTFDDNDKLVEPNHLFYTLEKHICIVQCVV